MIEKHRHRNRYAQPTNPYSISVGFGLERVFMHLKELGCAGGTTHFVFEKRGPKEDAEIEEVFRRVCEGANFTRQRLPFEIVMADKKCNSAGLQIADLVARPVGRKMLNKAQPNRAFDLIFPKFRRSPGGRVDRWGLKVFP